MSDTDWDCLEDDKILTFEQCPESITTNTCANYTFTEENIDQQEPVMQTIELLEGEACWTKINRTIDGSYGTLSIFHENRHLFVFDELERQYRVGDELGLLEIEDAAGW